MTIGIETQQAIGRPILIIKTAWGGKSLHTDFRSSGAGGEPQRTEASGAYYDRMIAHVERVLGEIPRIYPEYDAAAGYELAGFVWFQGWDDVVDQGVYAERGQPGGYDTYT